MILFSEGQINQAFDQGMFEKINSMNHLTYGCTKQTRMGHKKLLDFDKNKIRFFFNQRPIMSFFLSHSLPFPMFRFVDSTQFQIVQKNSDERIRIFFFSRV